MPPPEAALNRLSALSKILKKRTSRKSPSADKEPDKADASDILAALKERKEKAVADRLQVQTEILRGDIIRRELVTSAAGGLYSIYRNTFLDIGESSASVICAMIGLHESEAHKVRKVMTDTAYACVNILMDGITAFITGGG